MKADSNTWPTVTHNLLQSLNSSKWKHSKSVSITDTKQRKNYSRLPRKLPGLKHSNPHTATPSSTGAGPGYFATESTIPPQCTGGGEFPVTAFLQQLRNHSRPCDPNSQACSNPWLHTLVSIREPSSRPGKYCHQPSATSPAALEHRSSQVSFTLRNASWHLDIHPVANAESRGESSWAFPRLWPAPELLAEKGVQLIASRFMHNLCQYFVSLKSGLPLIQQKPRMLSVLPCLLVCEAKSREKVKGLINLQFIFIVSRCFNLLVLGATLASLLRLPRYIVSRQWQKHHRQKTVLP